MQFTFSDHDVRIDPDGNGEDVEPTDTALATLAQELEEYLLGSYIVEDMDALADSNSLLGTNDF